MDRSASASRLLDLLLPQWQERPQRWALDGWISRSELAIRLVARPFAPLHAISWTAGSAGHVCSRARSGGREHGLCEP